MMEDRFQHQKWPVKIWRMRWLVLAYALLVFDFAIWLTMRLTLETGESWEHYCNYKFRIGVAHVKMRWLYTMDEVKERIGYDCSRDS